MLLLKYVFPANWEMLPAILIASTFLSQLQESHLMVAAGETRVRSSWGLMYQSHLYLFVCLFVFPFRIHQPHFPPWYSSRGEKRGPQGYKHSPGVPSLTFTYQAQKCFLFLF